MVVARGDDEDDEGGDGEGGFKAFPDPDSVDDGSIRSTTSAQLPGKGSGVFSPDCKVIADLYQATGPWKFTPELTNCCNTQYPNSASIKCNAQNQIVYIYLAGQGLSGKLPASLGTLTSLRYLLLNYNSLTGPIPRALVDLPLYILDLSHNQLSGSLPSSSGWVQLETLNLEANALTGELPSWLFTLPRLKSLALGQNQFTTGDPPPTIRFTLDRTLMDEATLQRNAQIDPATWRVAPSRFLERFATLPRISELKLDGLGISGGWPSAESGKWGASMVNLTKLDLSKNMMQGTLPAYIAGWTRLKTLLLDNNEFGGPIPSLANLTMLRVLDLSFNQLTGPIPAWATAQNMTILNLSHNLLSGPFPMDNHHLWQSCSVAGNYFVCTKGPEAVLSYLWRSSCRATCTDTQQTVPLVRPPVDINLPDIKSHASKNGVGRVHASSAIVRTVIIFVGLTLSLIL
ncbi:hypothetical protein DFQ27_009243 [Actinomortierella ambigua]|uniref:L domain-like protein n=1 Tax=Actinomortierella ambigua TaxID=1343610 RepID=A0A9P6QH15_9FUNG|nr:hypothetical protein DFQ27_009243 [Actinomortierella ambigua]